MAAARVLLLACATALASAGTGAIAQPGAPEGGRCEMPAHDGHPMQGRQERIAQFEQLGEHCLKRIVVQCDGDARQELLDPGRAFSCSIGYEALLRRGFGGDFQALLQWWRSRAEEVPLIE